MGSTLEIIKSVVLLFIIITLVVYYVFKAIKNGWLTKVLDTITRTINLAEKTGKSGQEKKQMVIDAVVDQCNELGIPYSLIKNLVSKFIDRVIKDHNIVVK